MATTAKQQTTVRGSSSSTTSSSSKTKSSSSLKSPGSSTTSLDQSSNFLDSEEDIATIAKQISDHAEAIYQTWKARGLAPTEILNCHTSASDAFGKALTPPSRNSLDSPVAEFLTPDMSNNNLEKLVSSFVNEDKARQQAARKSTSVTTNILTSGTIKDALRKFENNTSPAGYVKPNFLIRNTSSKTSYQKTSPNSSPVTVQTGKQIGGTTTSIVSAPITSSSSPTSAISSSSSSSSAAASSSSSSPTQLSKNVPDVLMDTIGQGKQLPKTSGTKTNLKSSSVTTSQSSSSIVIDSTPSTSITTGISSSANSISVSPLSSNTRKPQTPAKPANLINHTPSWPLKNRISIGSGVGVGVGIGIGNTTTNPSSAIKNGVKNGDDTTKTIKTIELGKNSADLLDEVSREEERLINALKTGIVLNNNDNKLPEVITSTLTDKTDRNTSWNKTPDVSSTISSGTSIVAAKSTSSATQGIGNSGKNLTSWNNDTTKTTIITTTHSGNQSHQQQQKTETMSPAPAPAPAPTKIKLRPKNDAAVPHPEAKMNIRPFLTRGSVAERVLMFEKCPDVKAPLRNINRESSKTVAKPLAKPTQQTHTTLQRHIRSSSKNVYIPRFHFPHGKPLPTITTETTLQRLVSAFDSFPNKQVSKLDFHHILKICGLPFYWRMPLIACTQHATSGLVDGYRFIEFWKQMSVYCHETASRFVYILSRGQRSRPYILHEDLATLVQDVVDTHPGLAFLKEAAEFHSRYVHTVIARIFYSVNRSWSGKITVPELRRSNLLQVIQLLEEEEDINQIMAFFSYEHFYVIYCKFWELDRDHDLFIDQNDLARHNDHALSTRIIERIFSGCVTRGGKARINGSNGPKMSYTDFVWFLLSEEDKTNPTAIEYWFRCMDLDGDGVISMYELEYFYEEQQQRMESIGIETLPFEDCLCQMLDMIKPVKPGCITLSDLKRCRMTPIFFDTFFNLEKYLEHEQRDPFATQRDNDDMTDWDRYAAQEYELLVAEEGGDTQG